MVMFQHMEAPLAAVPQMAAQRLLALGAGRRLTSRLLATDDASPTAEPVPLVALHGISRNARAMWQAFGPLAAAEGRALLVPRFADGQWPRFQQIGRVRPDLALLDLFKQAGLADQRVDLFGFSGGAQLAHRFAMLYPHRVATLHLAAPGWYTLPDVSLPWPQGLAVAPSRRRRAFDAAALSRLQLRQYLSLRVRLWVGAEDTARDASLRQTADLDACQGKTRLERAFRYARAFEQAARVLGLTPDIDLTVLPGCGHDFTECDQIGGLAARVVHGG
ncbi:alpha/beta fold hydrolase [Tabrizicola aquatica]|uniref:alpha/beta fold hydrolase n=1 Tax=Tabrizicola aquatica TaxID=909926 RepID=UPI000CD27E5C|nr:alpha/beta hydrolase [Tabrizicola aquatica]